MLTASSPFMGRRMRSGMGSRSRMCRRGRMIHLRPRLTARMHLRLRMAHRRTRRTIHRRIVRRMRRMIHRRIVRMVHRRRIAVRCSRPRTYMPRTRRRMIVECHRPRYRGRSRTPMIHIGKSIPVLMRRLLVLCLHRRGRNVMLVHRPRFVRRRPCLHTAGTAIETRPAGIVDDHGIIDIRIVNDGSIYARNSRVVTEMPAIPLATAIPSAAVTKPIINTAIKTYMRAPITGMPGIDTAAPTPISRGPQKANGRRRRPITGNPVIARIIVPGPVTRHPEITVHRTKRLFVNRYGRRCNMHRNSNADLRVHSASRKTQG